MFRSRSKFVHATLALALIGAGGAVYAQLDGADRGAAPIDSSGSFEVNGIDVDVSGKDGNDARLAGWRIAQRKGWTMLAQRLTGHASTLSDSTLDSLSDGIVVEHEEIGPNRYIARLGVLFDRNRAGAILGVAAAANRSAPMLVIPVIWTGGAGRVFERTTPWQEAWARFRTGNSTIDYVRPIGTGPDPLLLNVGQTGRRGRGWWRNILDQYGASDVLVPEVKLYRQWPGGPITAIFTARHGPDNQEIANFRLRVNSSDGLDALLDAGVARIDAAYQQALQSGVLRTDSLLAYVPPPEQPSEDEGTDAPVVEDAAPVAVAPTTSNITVQFDTPAAAAVSAGEASVRGVPGVQSATTTSLALGGVSVMRVTYAGDVAALRAALEARGWQVTEGGGVLRIRRAPPPPAPLATPTGEPTPQ